MAGRDNSSRQIGAVRGNASMKRQPLNHPNRPPGPGRQLQHGNENQDYVNLYRIDDASFANAATRIDNTLQKWDQDEEDRWIASTAERIAATAEKASDTNVAGSTIPAAAVPVDATENMRSLSGSGGIMAQDVIGKAENLRTILANNVTNISGGHFLVAAIVLVFFFVVAAVTRKVKILRRNKGVSPGPAGPDTAKRRNSNEECNIAAHCYIPDSHEALTSQAPSISAGSPSSGLVRKPKPTRRRSLGDCTPPDTAFAGCQQRDTAFAKERRADTLVNAMPPDIGGKYKQRIVFARRHSLTKATCRALDAALSTESGHKDNNNDEEISINSSVLHSALGNKDDVSLNSSAFDLDV